MARLVAIPAAGAKDEPAARMAAPRCAGDSCVDTAQSAMLLTYDLDAGLWVLAPGSRFAPAKPQLTRGDMPIMDVQFRRILRRIS